MVVIASFKQPESPVKLEQGNVEVILDKKVLGEGTLFVSERTLSWQKSDHSFGFSMDYFNISLHAISKDPNVHAKECIYILTDPHINISNEENSTENNSINDNDDSEAESEPDVSELILVPVSTVENQNIYDKIKLCQALNPDPADVDNDEDIEDDNLYVDAEEEMVIVNEEITVECEENGRFVESSYNTKWKNIDVLFAAINNLSQRLQNNSFNINYNNGNEHEDEDFQDAD